MIFQKKQPLKAIAVIPARGGSIGIVDKNIKYFCGVPLIEYAIKVCKECPDLDEIWVLTDDTSILAIASRLNVHVFQLSDRSANGTTEDSLLEFYEWYSNECIMILVQCTNPFIKSRYLTDALYTHLDCAYKNSILSVTSNNRYIWEMDKGLKLYNGPRQKRQLMTDQYMENGAFYVFNSDEMYTHKNRLYSRILPFKMPDYSHVELDNEDDWFYAEYLYKKYMGGTKK